MLRLVYGRKYKHMGKKSSSDEEVAAILGTL